MGLTVAESRDVRPAIEAHLPTRSSILAATEWPMGMGIGLYFEKLVGG